MDEVREHLEMALKAISKQKDALSEKMNDLARQEAGIHDLLNRGSNGSGGESHPLIPFILQQMERNGTINIPHLQQTADGEGIEYSDGRTFNALLMTLERHGRVERLPTGLWKLSE